MYRNIGIRHIELNYIVSNAFNPSSLGILLRLYIAISEFDVSIDRNSTCRTSVRVYRIERVLYSIYWHTTDYILQYRNSMHRYIGIRHIELRHIVSNAFYPPSPGIPLLIYRNIGIWCIDVSEFDTSNFDISYRTRLTLHRLVSHLFLCWYMTKEKNRSIEYRNCTRYTRIDPIFGYRIRCRSISTPGLHT